MDAEYSQRQLPGPQIPGGIKSPQHNQSASVCQAGYSQRQYRRGRMNASALRHHPILPSPPRMSSYSFRRTIRTLDEHLRSDEAIARLKNHAERLQQLQAILVQALPPALTRNCRVANFKQGVLIIHTENGALASKLRQMTTSIATRFRQQGEPLSEILIRVQPLNPEAPPTPRPRAAHIGEAGRQALNDLAGTLPEGGLKTALTTLLLRSLKRSPGS